MVWQGQGQDDDEGIFGQRYDSGGVAQGDEFRVNSYTTNFQRHPSVASDASGTFVVVWTSGGQDGGSGTGVFGQRYNSGGVAQGAEFRVNSHTTGFQVDPSIASDASGNVIVVWESNQLNPTVGVYDIFGQRYNSEGVAQGVEFLVNSFTGASHRISSVASDASGNFVVVWQGQGQDGSGVFGQRYDSAGGTLGSEFRVNTYTTLGQRYPSVASDASGNFVVAWILGVDLDGSGYGLFGRRYDSAGVAQKDRFHINSYTTSSQRSASAAATGTDQFVVVWTSHGQDGSGYGIFGQRFDFADETITVVSPNTNVKSRIGSVRNIQ